MSRELVVYPNCSKGGVTSVIRGRASNNPEMHYDVIFFTDRGGRDAFSDLPNVSVRICREDRAPAFITRAAETRNYSLISFLSCPRVVSRTNWPDGVATHYEFHSSNVPIIEKELQELPVDRMTQIVAPSDFMARTIRALLPSEHAEKMIVVPNLVDHRIFREFPPDDESMRPDAADFPTIPLIWVGRFDKGKSYRSFLRLLGTLPSEYTGIFIVSLESDPNRAAEFLGEAAQQRVDDRISLRLNLPQSVVSSIYRDAAASRGFLISTSLQESFGYTVAEALATGLRTIAFDLPALREHVDPKQLLTFVDIGSVTAIRSKLLDFRRIDQSNFAEIQR